MPPTASVNRLRNSSRKNALAAAVAAFALASLMGAAPAFAIDKIYSPHVVQGEGELEYFGTRTFDNHRDKNDFQEHEISIGYGVTNWWAPEFYGIFEKQPDESTRLTGMQFENHFQLAEPGEYWVDPGLLVAYTHATHKEDPDTLEVKLLLEKQTGKFLHRVNIGGEQEIGNHAQGGPDRVFLWGSRYRYDEHFEPGFEIQSDFGKGSQFSSFSQQEHYIGPAAYGLIFPNVKYEAAYLFGVSDAASKGAARVLLEYEKFF